MWYYTSSSKTSPEEERDRNILAATRNAPAWVLRRINEDRRAQGLPEFRSGQFATLTRHERILERGFGTICGLATYGVSLPVRCKYDTRYLEECFKPTAFVGSVAESKRGLRNVWLSLGHTPESIADTASGTLSLHVHPTYGLQFWAKMENTPEHRRVVELARGKRLGVSVSFHAVKQDTRYAGRPKPLRVILEGELVHIALLDLKTTPPAYRSSIVAHTWNVDAESVCRALHRCRLASYGAYVGSKVDARARG